jgi:hypothetical protein
VLIEISEEYLSKKFEVVLPLGKDLSPLFKFVDLQSEFSTFLLQTLTLAQ